MGRAWLLGDLSCLRHDAVSQCGMSNACVGGQGGSKASGMAWEIMEDM